MNDTFIENLSPIDFNSTVDKLSKEIEKKSWKISNVYDLQKTMDKFGKDVLPVKVFSLCHPNHSSRILEKDFELKKKKSGVIESSAGGVLLNRDIQTRKRG